MPKGNESTTKFKADISELKSAMQEAQRSVRLANSEFKAATAGMDNWSKSADGLSAKTKQLTSVLDAENAKLKSLEQQYALTAKEQGENSKGAQELMIKINNQKASIGKIESQLTSYSAKLEDAKNHTGEFAEETKKIVSASDKLKSTIEEQEAELASLKNKYASVILEQGEMSTEANQLASKIGSLSSELKQNKSALNDAKSGADQFDNSLDDIEESAESTGGGFTVMKGALADLVSDGIKKAVDAFKELVTESDKANASFQASTGATAAEMEKFSDSINNVYANNFGEDLNDVAEKMAYVKQVTGEVDPTQLEKLTENAMTLEDTFGSDFNETIRGVTNLMNHFGIDAETAFDLFAKGSQEGLDYTDELGDNVAEYGGNFQQAGYSAQEYFQLLKNGSQGGAYNLDKVNDSINEVKNRLGDGTIEKNIKLFSDGTQTAFKNWQSGKGTMKDVIDSIVGDINNCKNEQEALTMAQTAFGTMGEDANLKVVKSLTTTGKTFDNVKGKMEEVAEVKYGDIGSQLSGIGRQLRTELLQPIVNEVTPAISDMLGKFSEKIPAIKEALAGALQTLKEWTPVIAGIGTAIGTYFVATKIIAFVNAIKSGTLALKLMAAAQKVLNLVMSMNPIGLIIAAIAGLVVAFVVAYKKVDWFRKMVDTAFGAIKTAIQAVLKFFTETIPNAFTTFVNILKNLPESIKSIFKKVITAVTNFVTNFVKKAKDGAKKFFNGLVNGIKNLPTRIKATLTKVITFVINFVSNFVSKAKDGAKKFLNALVNGIKNLPSNIKNTLTKIITAVAGFVTNFVKKATEAAKNFGSKLVNGLKELPSKVVSIGKNVVEGIWKGIINSLSWIKGKIKGWVGDVVKFIKNLFKIKSPSRLMRDEVGVMIAKGIAVGIANGTSSVTSAVTKLGKAAVKAALKVSKYDFSGAGSLATETLKDSINTRMNNSITTAKNLVETQLKKYDKSISDYEKKRDKKVNALEKKRDEKVKALEKKRDATSNAKTKNSLKKQITAIKNSYSKQITSAKNSYSKQISLQKDFQSKYKKASEKAITAYSTAIKDYAEKANDLIQDTIDGITSTYQAKYDALVASQDALISKMKSYGDLYTVSSAGVMTINNINDQTKALEKYIKALNSIKGKVSADLFSEIANMDIDEGTYYINQLLAMSGKELDAYVKAYEKKQKLAETASKNLYKNDIAQVATDYKKSINSALGTLQKDLTKLGQQAMAGFSSGLKSSVKGLNKDVKSIANSIIKQFKTTLKIHSPSRVFAEMGGFSAQGYVQGFEKSIDKLKADLVGSTDFSPVIPNGASGSSASGSSTQITQNFYQTNNSPKSLSRLEIYRQTKNQLAFAKGV